MGDVKIVFSADTNAAAAAVQQLAGSVKSQLEHLAASVVAAFSVHAIKEWIQGQIEASDQAGKTAEKINLSVEAYSALTAEAKSANVEQAELVVGLKTLANVLVDAARGSEQARR